MVQWLTASAESNLTLVGALASNGRLWVAVIPTRIECEKEYYMMSFVFEQLLTISAYDLGNEPALGARSVIDGNITSLNGCFFLPVSAWITTNTDSKYRQQCLGRRVERYQLLGHASAASIILCSWRSHSRSS